MTYLNGGFSYIKVGLLQNKQEGIREKDRCDVDAFSEGALARRAQGADNSLRSISFSIKHYRMRKREVILSVIHPYPTARIRFQTTFRHRKQQQKQPHVFGYLESVESLQVRLDQQR